MNMEDELGNNVSKCFAKPTRRQFLREVGAIAASAALAGADGSRAAIAATSDPIRIGVAADLTGALSFTGRTFPNVANMIADEVNASGGLLGRQISVHVEDTATNEAVSVTAARKLIERDNVDVVVGGITSSARNALKDVVVGRGKKIYIYPMSSEGIACTPLLYATGASTSQQCSQLVPWLRQTGAKRFALLGSDYVWPQSFNKSAKAAIEASGGEVTVQELFPMDQLEFGAIVNRIMTEKVDVVLNSVIPPGLAPLFKRLYEAGFSKNGGRLACVFYDESLLSITPPEEVEGIVSCSDYFPELGKRGDPTTAKVLGAYAEKYPGVPFTSSSGATGIYRGLKMWVKAVQEAGTTDSTAVATALDHGHIDAGPGAPAAFDPGHRRCAMKMYVAVAKGGHFDVVSESEKLLPPESC